jgi:hypothetical protein
VLLLRIFWTTSTFSSQFNMRETNK